MCCMGVRVSSAAKEKLMWLGKNAKMPRPAYPTKKSQVTAGQLHTATISARFDTLL